MSSRDISKDSEKNLHVKRFEYNIDTEHQMKLQPFNWKEIYQMMIWLIEISQMKIQL